MIPIGRSLQRTPVQRVPEEENAAGAERIDTLGARAGGRQVPGKQHSRAPLRSLHGNIERRDGTESYVAKGAKRSLLQSELSFSDERQAKEFFDQVGHKTARNQALDAPSQSSSWKQVQSLHPPLQLPFGNNQKAANSIQKSSNVGVRGYLPAQDARREEGLRIRDQHSSQPTIAREDLKRKITSRAAPALSEASVELSVEASTPQSKVNFPTKQTRNVVPSGNQLSRTPPEIGRMSQNASTLPKPMPKNANDQEDTTKADAEFNSGTVNKAQNQNVVPSGKQLARTPIEEPTQVTGLKQRQLEQCEATSRHRNIAPSGNQLSRTPPATVHQEARNHPDLLRVMNENSAMNVELSSGSLLTQTPSGIASETNAPLSTVAEQDLDLPWDSLSSGAQLARAPQLSIVPTRSETTAFSNSVDAPPSIVNAAMADGSVVKPQDTLNNRPKPRNVVPTGSQLSRTPPTIVQQEARTEESLVVERSESDIRQNVVPSGNQLARTPIGLVSEALNVPTSSPSVVVPNVEEMSLTDNKLGKSLDPGVEHGASVRKSSSSSEQPLNSSSADSKPRNIVPSGSQLARTPTSSTFEDVQMEASDTSAGPDESKSRVEHVQTLGGTVLCDEVFLDDQEAVPAGTQLARTPQSGDTSCPRNTVVNADTAEANMNNDNCNQQIALRENISPNTSFSEKDLKRRNIVPTGSHLSRTPPSSSNQDEKTEEQLHSIKERSSTVERRNKVPTGSQLARTPVGETLKIEASFPSEAPRASEQPKNVVPTGSQLVRTPQLDDSSLTSIEDINVAAILMTQKDDNLLLDKKQSTEIMHSAIGGRDSLHVSFSDKDPKSRNIVPTGSQLSRTPPSSGNQEEKNEEQLHPNEERNTAVERRNEVPTGTQLARTPVGETPETDPFFPDETPTVLELSKGVVPTGSLLARKPQSDNPMCRESTIASLSFADGTSMESSETTQMRNVVPTGKQLDRTPVNESSKTENQRSEHAGNVSNAPIEPSAHPLQVVPTVYNISKTPLREEPMLTQPNELEMTTLRNAVPTGGQLARTPIGEEPSDAVAKQGMQVTKAPGGQYFLNGKPVDENTPPASLKVSSELESTLANSNSPPTRRRAASKENDLNQEGAQIKNNVPSGQNRDRGGGNMNAPEISQRDHRGRRELRRLEQDRRKPTTREIHEQIFYGSSTKKRIAKRNETPKSRNDKSHDSAKQGLREDSLSSTEEDDEGWNNYEYDDTGNQTRDSLDNQDASEFLLQDTRNEQVSTRDNYAQNNDSPASHGESDQSKRARKLLNILFQLKKLREGGQRTSHQSCTEAIEWMLQQSFLKPTKSLTPKLLEKCIGRINSELSSMQLNYHRKKKALDAIQAYNSQVLAQQNVSTSKGVTQENQAAVQGLVQQWHANQAILSQIDQRIQECGAELASAQDPHLEPELQSMRIQHGCLQKELQNLHQLQRVQSNTMAVKRLLRRVELFLVRYESLRRATKGIDQYLQTYW